MNDENGFEDDFLRNIVKSNARTLPNQSFEDQLMSKINAEEHYRNEVMMQLKKSLKCFSLAISFAVGLVLVMLFGELSTAFNSTTIEVLALFSLAIIAILNVDNYSRLITKYSI